MFCLVCERSSYYQTHGIGNWYTKICQQLSSNSQTRIYKREKDEIVCQSAKSLLVHPVNGLLLTKEQETQKEV